MHFVECSIKSVHWIYDYVSPLTKMGVLAEVQKYCDFLWWMFDLSRHLFGVNIWTPNSVETATNVLVPVLQTFIHDSVLKLIYHSILIYNNHEVFDVSIISQMYTFIDIIMLDAVQTFASLIKQYYIQLLEGQVICKIWSTPSCSLYL